MIESLLLIPEPSVMKLYREMNALALSLFPMCITLACIAEYIGGVNFFKLTKRVLVVFAILVFFEPIHKRAVEISFKGAGELMKRVSPRNPFMKKFYERKYKEKKKENSSFLSGFVMPNLHELVSTTMYVLVNIFMWLLKLIYSSVYHLTYVFSSMSALLYLFSWTNSSLRGIVSSTLWCMLMPFVIVSLLVLVGNTITMSAPSASVGVSDIELLIWLFGITLLLLISPLITLNIVKSDGFAGASAQMGTISLAGATYTKTKLIQAKSKIPYQVMQKFKN